MKVAFSYIERSKDLAHAILLFFVISVPLNFSDAHAQNTTSYEGVVERLGTVNAAALYTGLGFNIDISQPWQIEAAASVGSRHVRIGTSWATFEPNGKGKYTFPSNFITALKSIEAQGLIPVINISYGPGSELVARGTVSEVSSQRASTSKVDGTRFFKVTLDSGSSYTFNPETDYLSKIITMPNGTKKTVRFGEIWQYPGVYINGAAPADGIASTYNLELGAPVITGGLNVGDRVLINRRGYPPPKAELGDADPSNIAFADMVKKIGYRLSYDPSIKISTFEIEIDNEPVWPNDGYINGLNCMRDLDEDGVRDGCFQNLSRYNLVLKNRAFYRAARLIINGGTHKTGFNGLIGPRNTTIFEKDLMQFATDAFHPYPPSGAPEQLGYYPDCLKRADRTSIYTCGLIGGDQKSNFKWYIWNRDNIIKTLGYAPQIVATEAGLARPDKLTYVLRQYLWGMIQMKLNYMLFYDIGSPDYGNFDSVTQAPRASSQGLKILLNAIRAYKNAPAGTYNDSIASREPSVVNARGNIYPVTQYVIRGARTSTQMNADIIIASFQRTFDTDISGDIKKIATPGIATIQFNPRRFSPLYNINLTNGKRTRLTVTNDSSGAYFVEVPVTEVPTFTVFERKDPNG